MARKDVDLVIRARDEAAKVVDTITKSLNEFTAAQATLESRSDKTQSSMGQLGAAIKQLDSAFKGLDVGNKLTKELNTAGAALTRLETDFAQTSDEALKLERQLRQTEAATTRYQTKLAGATNALARQSTVIKKAKDDQKQLTQAQEEAARAQSSLIARQEKLPGLISRQSEAVDKASARYADLSAKISQTVEPSKTLQQQFEASARNVDRTTTRLTALRTEYGAIGASIATAGAAVGDFGARSEKATANVAKQEVVLGKIAANLNNLKVATSSAAREQGKLGTAFSQITGKLASQNQAIDTAERNYVDLAQAAGQADKALEKLSGQSIGVLAAELKNQKRAALEAKREMIQLGAVTGQYGSEVSRVGVPTRQLAEDFRKARVESVAAKANYTDQKAALELLGRAFREAGTDLESIRAAQERFIAIQAELASKMKATAAAASTQQAELNQIFGASKRAEEGTRKLTQTQNGLVASSTKAASATGRLASAYREFYGDTRRSLSLLQRIRGEVLSLAAAYGGLYGAITVLKGTIDATQQLEAAQSRLGVAFDGDGTRVASELDFLRRSANRLGVDMGTLATEYSKFNIATKGTSLEGAAARKIFVQVAEAARVNRSSTAELSGVFVALTQIVSKGAVQMEELRQQLGDRLPGALQIMADGLGVTTAQLIKMMEAGEITEAALIPFGDELSKRFGPGLGEALASTSVAIGRLGNAAFQALVKFGKAGFIESFTDFVNTLTEVLSSADFEAFSARASQALGGLVGLLGFFAQNFQIVVTLVTGFIGLRLAPVVIALAGSFVTAKNAALGAAVGIRAASAGAATGVGVFASARAAVTGLAVAFRTLLGATGIGLAITAIAAAIGYWSTQADDATEALNAHQKIVDDVKTAYEAAGGAVDAWRNSLDALTVTEAKRNLQELKDALADTIASFNAANRLDGANLLTTFFGTNLLSGASQEYNNAIEAIIRKVNEGVIDIADLRTEIDKVNTQFDDGSAANQRYAFALDEAAEKVVELAEKVREAEAVVKVKTGTDEDAADAAEALGIAYKTVNDELDPEKTAAYTAAVGTLKEIIEETTKETGLLADTMKIEGAFQSAIDNAQTLAEKIGAALDKADALQGVTQKFVDANFGSFTSGTEATAALLRESEGFRATPYYDVNAYRVGYGSDTVTLEDGSIQKVVQGMTVSVADANRDLLRRINTEFMPAARNATGTARFDAFSPQQQAALTSIAYNYGSLPERIIEAVRTGSTEEIASAIQSLGGDNNGVNKGRRDKEAALFRSTAGEASQIAEQGRVDEERRKAAEDAAKKASEFREGLNEQIAQEQFLLSIEQQGLQDREVAKALRDAENEALKAGVTLTEEERAKIEQVTRAKFAKQAAEEATANTRERAQKAEEEVNRLLEIQNQLREQLTIANSEGDVEKATSLKDRIAEINTELGTAIENAIAMWQAIGGSEADAAIAKLQTAGENARTLGTAGDQSYFSWTRVKDLFVDGLAGAFDTFAQGIAEGKGVIESARDAFLKFAADFLIQIAQMIIKQAIFNALKSSFGGTGFGALLGLGHTGGMVGSSRVGSGNSSRRVNPAIFAGATKYHTGGVIGLAPNEVPIIAKKGEEMLTRDDPRHMLNGNGAQAQPTSGQKTKVVNLIDGPGVLEAALNSSAGERVILNWMRANADAISATRG